jgi:hypothetical protein
MSCDKGEKGDVANREFVPEEVAGWRLQDEVRTFDRRSIFDYIDGAGEVYLSFDFKDVLVYSYQREDSPEITAEIFDMGKAEDAYGVFTYARESEASGIGRAYEYRGSVLCFWQDRFYVCVTCYEQTDETREVLPDLARDIANRLPDSGSRPELVDVLPEDERIPHSERFFHLHSSLNYHYFVARENLLNMSSETRAVMARYASGSVRLLCVQYPDSASATEGFQGFMTSYLPESNDQKPVQMENDLWTAAGIKGRYVMVVFDTISEDQALRLLDNLDARLAEFKK